MPLRSPSLQLLARTLGLSRTTVSDALRGKGRVSQATIDRVQKCAKSLGYQPNPLVATVLGSINRGRGSGFRGSLAVVDIHEPGHWPHGPFPREIVAGAKGRAVEMGFAISEFVAGGNELPWRRLDSILQSRGIHGIIVLPAWITPDLSQLNWSRYAGIYTDVTASPELHSVCSDHYGSMVSLLHRLRRRDYRSPGLILQRGRDERIAHRHTAAFTADEAAAGGPCIPPLITAGYPDFKKEFLPWFRRHQPDVVLSHFAETQQWIHSSAPGRDVGFVLLNILEQSNACAALDLQPRVLGARAVELVIGQILRNEFGIPEWPSRTTVEARWIEGPTVRPPPAAATHASPVKKSR